MRRGGVIGMGNGMTAKIGKIDALVRIKMLVLVRV